jgi:hypothetical protein
MLDCEEALASNWSYGPSSVATSSKRRQAQFERKAFQVLPDAARRWRQVANGAVRLFHLRFPWWVAGCQGRAASACQPGGSRHERKLRIENGIADSCAMANRFQCRW